MRIAIVSLQFEETATGGGGVHVQNICEEFVSEGHMVTVISIHTDKTSKSVQFLSDKAGTLSVTKRGYLDVIRFLIERNIPHPYVGNKKAELSRILRFASTVFSWLKPRLETFDVINLHGHHIIPGLMAKAFSGMGSKIISTVHSLETTYMSEKGESFARFEATEELLAKLRKWEAQSRFADHIILNSPAVCSDFKKILNWQDIDPQKYENKIKLISSGCNEAFIMSEDQILSKLSRFPEKINLVTFCRIDPSKGIEYSINGAIAAAKKCTNDLNLTIAGIAESKEYLSMLQSMSKNTPTNLEITFKILDKISSSSEKKQILDDKHIYILPTLKEPFGMTLIEASARGNMIVSTDNTGPSYILSGNEGKYLEWGTATPYGALAIIPEDYQRILPLNIGKAIIWTIENWEKSILNTIDFNKKIKKIWTWKSIAGQYLDLFETGG